MRKALLGVAIAAVLGLSSVAATAIHKDAGSAAQPNQVTREGHARAVEARGEEVLAHHDSGDRSGREGNQDRPHGDDPSTHESGDDNGGLPEAGQADDHSGTREAEPGDDHGHQTEPEQTDDSGGHGGRDG